MILSTFLIYAAHSQYHVSRDLVHLHCPVYLPHPLSLIVRRASIQVLCKLGLFAFEVAWHIPAGLYHSRSITKHVAPPPCLGLPIPAAGTHTGRAEQRTSDARLALQPSHPPPPPHPGRASAERDLLFVVFVARLGHVPGKLHRPLHGPNLFRGRPALEGRHEVIPRLP